MSVDQRMATTLSARKAKGTFRSLKAYDRRQASTSGSGKGKEMATDGAGMVDFVRQRGTYIMKASLANKSALPSRPTTTYH